MAGSVKPTGTLDGFDIWGPILTGKEGPRKEMLYNINPICSGGQAAPPKAAIRVGDWKLLSYCYSVEGKAGGTKTGPMLPPEGLPKTWPSSQPVILYDLSKDSSETTDVAKQNPKVVSMLLERLASYASQMVEPMQWTPPYQGKDYFCANCPLRSGATGPAAPWTPWL